MNVFRSNGLLFDPETSIFDTGKQREPGCAVLHVSDPSCFHVSVLVITDDGFRQSTVGKVRVGIVNISHVDFEKELKSGKCFKDVPYAFDWKGLPSDWTKYVFPGAMSGLNRDRVPLHLYYKQNKLFYDARERGGDNDATKLVSPRQIPPGNYRPFICIKDPSIRLQLDFCNSGKRRRNEDDPTVCSKLARTLWLSRTFADATIVCKSQSIPVHRCVLAASSAFFERVFQAPMLEAAESRIVIDDVAAESVDAFLQYLYVGSLRKDVNLLDVLALAHRYGVEKLAKECCIDIVESICQDNVVKVMADLRRFHDDATIGPYFDLAVDRISGNRDLARRLALG
eukprot:TRINITY_DN23409_c1_g1_i2.p1 TRINITY_DN23409_c1_g1~~TRINITY_DN23409_c1_g1_i2.p1  ORF type:complete len:341 (+),score=32.50 TRINITY_DN23409_c1_g1_i2:66-1088(+)